jgi:hypothetical protein
MAFLGASVHVVEKRNSFGRHNILHLWDWVVRDLIGLGANGAEILGKVRLVYRQGDFRHDEMGMRIKSFHLELCL